MNVTCPSCETVYRVDPAKVPAGGVRARCAVCSNVFPVTASVTAAPATAAVSAGSGPAVAPRPPAPPPAPPAPPAPPTPAPAPPRTPAMPRFSGPIAAPPPPPRGPPHPPPRPPRPRRPAACSPGHATRCTAGRTGAARCASRGTSPPRGAGGAGRSGRARGRWARSADDESAPARESLHGAGSEAEGAPAGAGAGVGSRRVSSGEASAGTARRHVAATLQGRDREELAGIRGAGRCRAREVHLVLGGGAERDSRRGQ